MKTNHITRIVFCLLTTSFFLAESGQAQTADKPTETASSLEVGMYAISGPSPAIKINFNNTDGRAVRVMIRDQNGTVLYDEREYIAQYRRRFSVAELPAGHYKVQLSKGRECHTQTFMIEPPVPVERHVAMENSRVQILDKKLLANQ